MGLHRIAEGKSCPLPSGDLLKGFSSDWFICTPYKDGMNRNSSIGWVAVGHFQKQLYDVWITTTLTKSAAAVEGQTLFGGVNRGPFWLQISIVLTIFLFKMTKK